MKKLAYIPLFISLALVMALMVVVHPQLGSTSIGATGTYNETATGLLSNYMNNVKATALEGLTYIRKIYTIPESAQAPAPAEKNYGQTRDMNEVSQVVGRATELLEGQSLTWNPNITLWEDSVMNYYFDETILVITWKELINGAVCTFAEVKIADGSQLRRYLAGNGYGSSVRDYPTAMTQYVNGVVSINGDFYDYRPNGITVYQRELYRFNPGYVDNCFFTGSGDMIFIPRDYTCSKEEMEQFIKDNDVTFGLAFGPIMVENGQPIPCDSYALGEVRDIYSRAAIGQLGPLHYLLCCINTTPGGGMAATMTQACQYMADKGCISAYALDGGQTATIAMRGETVNRVDWGWERTMSDIIYFATALPEDKQ